MYIDNIQTAYERFATEAVKTASVTGTHQLVVSDGDFVPNSSLNAFSIGEISDGRLRRDLAEGGFDFERKAIFLLGNRLLLTQGTEPYELLEEISLLGAEGCSAVFMLPRGMGAKELEIFNFIIYDHITQDSVTIVLAVLKNTHLLTTKKKIITVALRLFAKDGYEAVSVRDIASCLGITQGALYRHFSGKRDILNTIIDYMQTRDGKRAKQFGVPTLPFADSPAAYAKTTLKQLGDYTLAQFDYWTRDVIASRFRRMLNVEQYRDGMNTLYSQYLSDGVIDYIADIFHAIADCDDPALLALRFWSPVLVLMGCYDRSENKQKIINTVKHHLIAFTDEIKLKEEK